MKTFDSKNVPPVSLCYAYSRQEETLVNEKPNKAARRLVPPVYGLCVYAPLLPCARLRVWKSGKRCALVSSPALPAGSWSGSAPGPTLWSGGALRLASTHWRWGDKRRVKIRKSNFMGDKTWPVSQWTSGHVGDHDPCVQKRAALSLSLSHLLGILFPPFTDINFPQIIKWGFGVLVIIHLNTGQSYLSQGEWVGGQICLHRLQFKKNFARNAKAVLHKLPEKSSFIVKDLFLSIQYLEALSNINSELSKVNLKKIVGSPSSLIKEKTSFSKTYISRTKWPRYLTDLKFVKRFTGPKISG